MTVEPATVQELERAIAGALTPAFLLAGIAGTLNVLSQRRNRLVDRLMQAHAAGIGQPGLSRLRLRARLALGAMQACILSGVLACALVVVVFLSQLHDWRAGPLIAALMLGGMGTLVIGLLAFFAEATLASTDLPQA